MLAQDKLGTVFTSPYNSPTAQHTRLKSARNTYRDTHQTYVKDCAREWRSAKISLWALLLIVFPGYVPLVMSGNPLERMMGTGVMLIALCIPIYPYVRYLRAYANLPTDDDARFKCPYCEAVTYLYAEWVCGHCKTAHHPSRLDEKIPAWVETCSNCGITPHALSCYKCSNHIVFDDAGYRMSPTELAYRKGYQIKIPEPKPKPTIDDIIPLKDRELHTLIVAMPRVGKSEAIKCFVHSLLKQDVACFVIDPHGDMAQEIAKWPNKRLIYLEYDLRKGYTPTINPFEIHGIDASDKKDDAIKAKKVVAQQLSAAFQQITEDFSTNMQAVLMPCILTLLDSPGATIRDLRRFMVKEQSGPLVQIALTRTHDIENVEFFKHQFHDKHLDSSKAAVRTKLSNLLNTGTFADLTCGPTTMFLERAWNDRRIVVLNLSKIGDIEAASWGTLLLALLQGIAQRRAEIDKAKRIPCHIYIDECHLFVNRSTPSAMAQHLKHGFILTLAHQYLGQMLHKDIESQIHKLTHLNLIGVTSKPQERSIANYFHLEPDDIASLSKGRFLVRIGNGQPFFYTFPDTLIENRGAMSDADWREVRESQLRQFYRPSAAPPPARSEPLPQQPTPAMKISPFVEAFMATTKSKEKKDQKEDDTAPGTW